mgnify:CR=1 FL=1
MNPLTVLTAFFQAATAALKALPWFLAWKVAKDLEQTKIAIIDHEAENTVVDRRRADVLRVLLKERERLNDALLSALPQNSSGNSGQDK